MGELLETTALDFDGEEDEEAVAVLDEDFFGDEELGLVGLCLLGEEEGFLGLIFLTMGDEDFFVGVAVAVGASSWSESPSKIFAGFRATRRGREEAEAGDDIIQIS